MPPHPSVLAAVQCSLAAVLLLALSQLTQKQKQAQNPSHSPTGVSSAEVTDASEELEVLVQPDQLVPAVRAADVEQHSMQSWKPLISLPSLSQNILSTQKLCQHGRALQPYDGQPTATARGCCGTS